MKQLLKILWISLLLLLTSCTGGIETQGSQLQGTITVAMPSTSMSTVIKTRPPTPLPTPEHDTAVNQNCLTILPSLPKENEYIGKIALENLKSGVVYILYDLKTGTSTEIPGDQIADFSASPDRTMFAINNWGTRRFEVFSTDGKRIKALSWGEYWGWIGQWLDNQRVVIVMSEPESPGSNFDKYPRDIIVVNLLDNKTQTLQSNYPDIDRGSNNLTWMHSGSTAYDNTLTRVVYPGVIDAVSETGMGYILYGIPEKRKLAQLPNPSFGNEPIWSPDGSQFIVMGDSEFYRVSRDGDISRVTHMNPAYDPSTRNGLHFYSYFYSWSSDGKLVALWLELLGTDSHTLAILDTHTGLITDTCIPWRYDVQRRIPYPVWSPDGRSLVVEANFHQEENGNDVVLVDLKKNAAYKIATNFYPVDWLMSP